MGPAPKRGNGGPFASVNGMDLPLEGVEQGHDLRVGEGQDLRDEDARQVALRVDPVGGVAEARPGEAAGAPPAAATIGRVEGELGWDITHVYGLTETAPFITVCEMRPEHAELSAGDRAVIKARQGVELVTSGDPYTITQAVQDASSRNPRWVPALSSASSASIGAYISTHSAFQAARVLYRFGLRPAALSLWNSGKNDPRTGLWDSARWQDRKLVMPGLPPLDLAAIAARAHARGFVTGAMVHAVYSMYPGKSDDV